MISFEKYLNLCEASDFAQARKIAMGTWINSYNKNHKDSKKTKNDVPDGIKNAKNKSELMDAIGSWKTSDNGLYKTAFNNITKIFNAEDSEDSEDSENSKDTDDKEDSNTEDTNKDTEKSKDSKNILNDKKELRKKQIEDAIKNPKDADYETLNTSEYVATYDEKTALKLADIESEKEHNIELLKKTERENAEKRAENFKEIMETLADFIKTLFPESNADDAISKIGDNAVEQQKKKNEQDAKYDNFERSTKKAYDNLDNEYNDKKDILSQYEKHEIEEAKLKIGTCANEIEEKCEKERKKLEHSQEYLNDLLKERNGFNEKLMALDNLTSLSKEQKEAYKKLKEDIKIINNDIDAAKEVVNNDKKAYTEKHMNSKKELEDKIKEERDIKIKEIKERYKLLYQKQELELKQKKSEIENSKNEYIRFLKSVNLRYNDFRDVPPNIRKTMEEKADEFKKKILTKEEYERATKFKNNDDDDYSPKSRKFR